MMNELTQQLLKAPWLDGTLARDFYFKGDHPKGEKVTWRIYHNDPDYISVRLYEFDAELGSYNVMVEFTETWELVADANRMRVAIALAIDPSA